jgi:hypothetical protein
VAAGRRDQRLAEVHQMKDRRFERFYLEKVAIGEGCGCAEQAISMLDMEARSQKIAVQIRLREPTKPFWSRFLDSCRRQRAGDK